MKIFNSEKSGLIDTERKHVLFGKERHDVGRPDDLGYPMRGIVSEDMLFLINHEPDRWPSCNPGTGYLHCDGSPTKTEILRKRTCAEAGKFWHYCFGKRPAEEFYDLKEDPNCMNNLASVPEYQSKKSALQELLLQKLAQQNDPRVREERGIFEKYLYADLKDRDFYNRYHKGEKMNPGWVNPSDFEKDDLEKALLD